MWKGKNIEQPNQFWEREKVVGLILPDSKIYSKAVIVKKMWYLQNDTPIGL